VLSRQRNRWQRGLIESLVAHRIMFFNPRYGIIGLLAVPFFFFFEMLGPVVELLGYVVFIISLVLGLLNVQFAFLFFSVAVVFGVVLSVSALVLEELSFKKYPAYWHVARLFLFCVMENFGYRQLHTWWRFRGIIDYLKGKKTWGAMERKGFTRK
jgi:cellulose synthase/poly-beta-1,6-N-acetylglucosamine synthase-like glycosyltransferase